MTQTEVYCLVMPNNPASEDWSPCVQFFTVDKIREEYDEREVGYSFEEFLDEWLVVNYAVKVTESYLTQLHRINWDLDHKLSLAIDALRTLGDPVDEPSANDDPTYWKDVVSQRRSLANAMLFCLLGKKPTTNTHDDV